MITRRQFIKRTAGATIGAIFTPVLANFPEQNRPEDQEPARVSKPIKQAEIGLSDLPYSTIRNLYTHEIIGKSPEPGRVVPGHCWLFKRKIVREKLGLHYQLYQSFPRGAHDLGSPSCRPHGWPVDFDMLRTRIEKNLALHGLSHYPDWVGKML